MPVSARLLKSLGIIAVIIGVLFVCSYIWSAIIVPWGNADQSLSFWYLPFLLFGLIAILKIGMPLIALARKKQPPE